MIYITICKQIYKIDIYTHMYTGMCVYTYVHVYIFIYANVFQLTNGLYLAL